MSMTTEIELALREKFEAWAEECCALPWGYLKKRRTYSGHYTEHTYTSLWGAWKAACEGMVEALEAALMRNAELEEKQRLIDICQGQGLEHRIAAENRAEAAEKRMAELEARTVKLPEPISVLHRRDFNDAHQAIYAYPEAEVNAALAVAGIQVIEGEQNNG